MGCCCIPAPHYKQPTLVMAVALVLISADSFVLYWWGSSSEVDTWAPVGGFKNCWELFCATAAPPFLRKRRPLPTRSHPNNGGPFSFQFANNVCEKNEAKTVYSQPEEQLSDIPPFTRPFSFEKLEKKELKENSTGKTAGGNSQGTKPRRGRGSCRD